MHAAPHRQTAIAALAAAGLSACLTGCQPNGRPNSLGEAFMPAIHASMGDTSSAAASYAARKVTDRTTWVQAGETGREVGRSLADRFYGACMLISCFLPDWDGENHPEQYGESYGSSYGN